MTQGKKINALLEKIESQAEEEIKKIEKSFGEKRKKLEEDFEKEKEEITSREKEKFEKHGELEKIKIISSARLQARRNILAAKRKVIEKVFDHVLDVLEDLPSSEARRATVKLLEQMVSTGEEKIIPSENFEVFSDSFIKKLNKERGWSLELEKPENGLRGWFKLEGENYAVSVDRAALRDFLKEQWESRVVEKLFGKKS